MLFRAEPLIILSSAVELGILCQPLFQQAQVILIRLLILKQLSVLRQCGVCCSMSTAIYIHQVKLALFLCHHLLYFSNSSLRAIHFSHCADDSKPSFMYDTHALYFSRWNSPEL